MAKRKESGKPEAVSTSSQIFSLRIPTETVKRVDALVAKLSHLSVKRAAVFKLAIARGLDVLEREHK